MSGHLLVVCSGFVFIGWLMNGLQASFMLCISTFAVCCYLVWVGSGGIALASVWVVAWMSMAAIDQHWFHHLPKPEYRYIPLTLLIIWLLMLGVVWRLGKLSDYLGKTTVPRGLVFSGLISLVLVSLVLGWQLYPQTLFFLSSL